MENKNEEILVALAGIYRLADRSVITDHGRLTFHGGHDQSYALYDVNDNQIEGWSFGHASGGEATERLVLSAASGIDRLCRAGLVSIG